MLIYLASPYTHPDPQVRDERAREVCTVAAKLIARGHHVIAPIAFFHQAHLCGNLPADFKYWLDLNTKLLSVCGELWIVTMEGWRDSAGITVELKIAHDLKMEVRYVNPITLHVNRQP